MYPSSGNSYGEIEKTLEIPVLMRKVDIFITWEYEGDTNATIYDEEKAEITWTETGEDLTADELNTIIKEPDTPLFDWIMDNLG